MAKNILHIINDEKFTIGFINYMNDNLNNYNHYFIVVIDSKNKSDIDKYKMYNSIKNVTIIFSKKNIYSKVTKKLFDTSDMIIINGVFNMDYFLLKGSKKIYDKLYLYFWGGDFYYYKKNKVLSIKEKIKKVLLHRAIKKCSGLIFLIDYEYEKLSEIFPNNNKHYVAAMAPDFCNKIDYDYYLREKNDLNRILIGNSASETNQHFEVLTSLSHLKNENIEIICPLSYGNDDYRNRVIEKGIEIFGEKFIPITDFMPLDRYLKLVNTCKVGIFNNDRQQALGNINSMLLMGKKIYLRDDTSMYKNYIDMKIRVFNISDLKNITKEELFEFDFNVGRDNNIIVKDSYSKIKKQWEKIFNIKI
ncbi:MAG: TDP-N-acetylfucosamine:lipid II N-acetylfucosaminyltransferase [Bacilli bacterium]|nr:TDP-N-acetylfucosamine:lipid II N-acetylfucosaminyltransferase [Bacilli bacterium]